jgi:hypothetical protein
MLVKSLVKRPKKRKHVREVNEYERITTLLIFNKKFWEKLIAYFPFTTN